MRRKPYWLVLLLTVAISPILAVPVGADTSGGSSQDFLTGPNDGAPEDIAVAYFQDNAADYGLSDADVAELVVRSSTVSRHTGATHVHLNQQFDGLEVFGADTTITIAQDGSVAFVGGQSAGNLSAAAVRSADAPLGVMDAVEAAADALDLEDPQDLRTIRRRGGTAQESVLTGGNISDEPIDARRGWQPVDDGLVLAWQVTIADASDPHLWQATVDAASGDLLELEDWTSDSSVEDLTALFSRGGGTAAAAASTAQGSDPIVTPNPFEDGSSYNVYALPLESPNDGGRSLITNPADADASPLGWHTVNAPGPDFTITRGNNVHAYTDWNNSDSPANPGTSTFVVDPPSSAAGEYSHSGAAFGPTATPANFSGDIVLVDDGSDDPTLGCEPFTVPAGAIALVDRGECPFVDKANNAQAGGASAMLVANNLAGAPILMGGADPAITIPSIMVSIDDGTTIKNGLPASGRIVLVPPTAPSEPDGGPSLTFDFPLDLNDHPHDYAEAATSNLFYWCNVAHDVFWHYGFDEQSGNFQDNKFGATIDGNPVPGGDYVRCEAQDGGGINNANFRTPALGSAIFPRMQMYLWNIGPAPLRDGDLEAGIILHEYSHGVSIRLTGGPFLNCLGGQQQAGEGWSDYHGIVTTIDPALDDPEGPRGMGTYALWQDDPPRQGAGIRPAPYSRNMFIQPATYESIRTGGWINGASVSQPHGIGHVWAAILWDLTWDLIDKHGFDANVYGGWESGGNNLSQQLVMDGLKIQGCSPSFVVARDAIITADQLLTGGDNQCTLWATFARRGLGFSAASATNARNAATEAFDTHPNCRGELLPPVHAPYGELNTVVAGDVKPLRFNLGSNQGLDILASNSPFSRQVDCDTLAVVSENPPFTTPRARPVATDTPGGSRLSVNRHGVYTYPWQTDADWAGTCRELVLTRNNGVQHRAYFEFID